jgi:hypothetical protein
MRYLLFLALVGCDDVVELEPDATPVICYNNPGTVCEAAHTIAKSYCDRIAKCGTPELTCEEYVVKAVCSKHDCSQPYDDTELKTCIEQYNNATCDVDVSVCKIY